MKNPFPSSIFCSSPLRSVLLFALSLFGLLPQTNAQYFRVTNDSMLLKNNNNTGVELIIENDTRNKTGAFLMNRLNGRTEFAYAADSIYIRNDSLLWRRGDGTRGIKLPSVNGGGGGSNSDTTAVTKVFFKSSETADSIFYRRNGIDSLAGIIDRQAGFKVGGLVTHRSGLTFDVTAANPYYIGTGRYASEAGEITLDPADDSLTRRDAIVLNTAGQIVKITGVPSTTPADPQPDPAVHYPLTYITVPPNSETPANVTSAIPYDEHVEWTVSSNSVTINPDNTTNVFTGTKSLSAGVTTSASYIDFTLPIGFNIADFTDFSFYIKLISGISNARINVKFFHGSTPVGNAVNISTSNGFTANKLTYQTIIIPMSSFAITQSDITKVRISTTGNTAGFFLDLLRFQKGISQGGNGSAFDWRIATPTQVGGIKTGGEGYYLDPDGKLHLAPINLSRYDSAYYRSDSLGPRKWKLTRLNGDTTYFELLPDSAHKLVSLGVTGSSPKTLTATLHNGETVSTTFSDISGGNSTDTASLSARINAKASQQALIDTAANIRASIPTGSSGTVSTVSVASANGFAGTVATATTTPAITIQTTVTGILKGNATSVSAAVSGTDFEGPIAAGSAGQYWRYDKTWQALNTTAVAEGSNLYFTNARSRLSISFLGENYLAYDNTTGVVTANSINLSGSHVTGTLAAGRIAGTATNGYVATLVGGVPTWAAASGGGGSTGWGLTGNSGTSYLTNFIGTTDNASLRFRANNIERLKIDSATGVFYNTTVASSS
ncbi:MAG TPA: hypothetical protein VF610_09875, partial [Segetibacter sp.]